jgi:hypothetical protein
MADESPLLNPAAAFEAPPAPEPENVAGAIPVEQFQTEEQKYGTPGQQAATAAESFGKGLLGPVFTKAEQALLHNAPEVQRRAEANPVTHYGSEALGLVAPAIVSAGVSAEARVALEAPEAISTAAKLARFTQAGVIGKAGEAAADLLGLEGAAATAAKMGTENALLAAGDELSKQVQGNPDSIQTAAINVGLSGLLGLGAGAALGKVSELWKAKVGPEADNFVRDFQARLNAHASDTLPTADAVHTELSQEFGNVNSAMEDLRGSGGLKSQDVQKLLPEFDPAMYEQGANTLKSVDEVLAKVNAEPGIYQGARFGALRDYANRLGSTLSEPELSSQKLFTALDDFKKGLSTLKRFDIFSPEVEKPGAALVGNLYHKVRVSLEDTDVWGQAGERQGAINKLFTEHIPASNDFQRAFTEKVGGEPSVSPGKVSTLVAGLGKPNAEIKLEKLANYLHANDRLYNELGKIHSNLGIENPFERPGLANTRAILADITPGMQAADFVRLHALNALSEGVASGAGGIGGLLTHIPGGAYIGSQFGHYALKPLIRTIMPALIKPILRAGPSGEALKAAFDGVGAIIRGESLANDAAKALFETGSTAFVEKPSQERLEKLDQKLSTAQKNPESMMNVGGQMGHYLPQHTTAMATTAQNAVNYLVGQRPPVFKNAPLDRTIPPNSAQMASYNRSLVLAEQPLMALKWLKEGRLQQKDVQDLKVMYPALYGHLTQKVNEAMTEHLSKEGQIPFKMRSGLSTLLGQPMDSTFKPLSIQAAQATFTQAPPPQQAKPTKAGINKLDKTSALYRTPSEARQANLNK